jgi:hypothetical protein
MKKKTGLQLPQQLPLELHMDMKRFEFSEEYTSSIQEHSYY